MKKTKTKGEKLSLAEVEKNLTELREKMRVIHFGTAGSKAKNVKEHGNVRREIARMETMKTALVSAK